MTMIYAHCYVPPESGPNAYEKAVPKYKGAQSLPQTACDAVRHPSHYDVFPDTQAIAIIRKTLTEDEFKGYLKGNILKYRLRAGEKDDPLQDLAKADKYREWLGDYY